MLLGRSPQAQKPRGVASSPTLFATPRPLPRGSARLNEWFNLIQIRITQNQHFVCGSDGTAGFRNSTMKTRLNLTLCAFASLFLVIAHPTAHGINNEVNPGGLNPQLRSRRLLASEAQRQSPSSGRTLLQLPWRINSMTKSVRW